MVDENVQIKNALHGHKTELMKKLRKDNIPDWFYSPGSRESARERWERNCKRNARIVSFEIHRDNGSGYTPYGHQTPPESVRDKLLDFNVEKHAKRFVPENQGYRVSFKLHVLLGEHGGVNDILVVAHYKN